MITDFTENFHFILLAATPQGTTFLIIALLALLLLTFVVSGAEVALFLLNSKDVNMLRQNNTPLQSALLSCSEKSRRKGHILLCSSPAPL